ncbi:MAG: cardiolipin synthase [Muribaculaceae bacterium]
MLSTIILSISLLEWVYVIITIAYACTVLSIIWVVISENRNPVRSLAWITVLLMVPVVGIVLYMFFGRSLRSTILVNQRLRRINPQELKAYTVDVERLGFTQNTQQTIRLAHTMCRAYYFSSNKVDIFTNGHDKFEALRADLKAATQYINMQYYIFENDHIGNEIRNILIDKAREGVKVRLIYDGVGSFNVDKRFFKAMHDAGIEAYPFMRINFPQFAQRVNWRNHRKILVIDGECAYIGGMNVADRYIDGCKWGTRGVWRDTHLRITGPAVKALQHSFAIDWNFMNKQVLNDPIATDFHQTGNAGIQLVTSGPMSQWNNIALMMLNAISNAKKCVYLQTPYFLPTESLLKALQTSALSGVDVRIMIPQRSDSTMLQLASCSYVSECLKAGIKFYFYNAGMLHAKTLIIDDELSTVGSTNFDFRSFEHNYEGNVFIYDSSTNAQLKQVFNTDMEECSTCSSYQQWMSRPKARRMLESLIRLLSPVL